MTARGAIVAVLLVACQPAGSDDGDGSPRAERAADADVAAAIGDSIRLWLEAPDEVRAGDPVPITLHVENISDGPLDLYLTGRPIAFDLVVTGPDGAVVWRRLEGEVVSAILRLETLDPGETLVLEDRWDQRSDAGEPVAPGLYRVHGELPAEDGPLVSPTATLRIIPR